MREKRIVLVNDVTGLSRCSVACQLPIISAMGIETAFVPTAILSINTYHKDFFFDDYTSKMNDYIETYKKMNPLWKIARGTVQTSNWNNQEKSASYLCSPSKWTNFLDTDKARYVIGAPSIEMFIESYNGVPHETGTAKGGLSAEYSTKDAPGYIYKVNGELQNSGYYTNDNTLDYKGYNSMYAGKNGSKTGYWWLASPSSRGSSSVCYVDGNDTYLDRDYYSTANGVGPLVSLKSGIQVQVEE